MANIIGQPDREYEYEFTVVTEREDGDFDWYGDYETAQIAYDVAARIGGIVAHNVRVSHKRLKRKPFSVIDYDAFKDLISRGHSIADIINELPPREIWQCKDCKYGYLNEDFDNVYCDYFDICMGMDDFCSRGEMKDE